MVKRSTKILRSGIMAIEAAVVYPILVLLILGLIVGGTAVFRYQQVAFLAREAARWASVRGSDWQKTTDQTSPSSSDIRAQSVIPYASGMDPNGLTVTVEWIDQITGTATSWDSASKDPVSLTNTGGYVSNKVRVSIGYQYSPNFWIVGPLNLQSVCEHPMSF